MDMLSTITWRKCLTVILCAHVGICNSLIGCAPRESEKKDPELIESSQPRSSYYKKDSTVHEHFEIEDSGEGTISHVVVGHKFFGDSIWVTMNGSGFGISDVRGYDTAYILKNTMLVVEGIRPRSSAAVIRVTYLFRVLNGKLVHSSILERHDEVLEFWTGTSEFRAGDIRVGQMTYGGFTSDLTISKDLRTIRIRYVDTNYRVKEVGAIPLIRRSKYKLTYDEKTGVYFTSIRSADALQPMEVGEGERLQSDLLPRMQYLGMHRQYAYYGLRWYEKWFRGKWSQVSRVQVIP